MKRVAAEVICGCAVAVFVLMAEARGAETSFREVLRRYIGHRKDTVEQSPPAGFPAGVDQVIALEYAVQLRKDGSDEAVDPESYRFKPGDQIRVRIQPYSDVYIYVFFEDEDGCRRCLLPSDKNSPRLAKHDQPIELPTDGTVFEFEAGTKGETLVLVASQEPDGELATLCEAVCKKREAALTPEERTTQLELRERNQRTLSAIQQRQSLAVLLNGQLSTQALLKVSREMADRDAADALFREPPSHLQPSALAVFLSKSKVPLKLAISVPLKSADATTGTAP